MAQNPNGEPVFCGGCPGNLSYCASLKGAADGENLRVWRQDLAGDIGGSTVELYGCLLTDPDGMQSQPAYVQLVKELNGEPKGFAMPTPGILQAAVDQARHPLEDKRIAHAMRQAAAAAIRRCGDSCMGPAKNYFEDNILDHCPAGFSSYFFAMQLNRHLGLPKDK